MKVFSYLWSVIFLVSLAMGCSSDSCAQAQTGPDLSPAMSPVEALDASEGWLASETAGLVVLSGPDGWEELEHFLFPLADASLSPGMPGTAVGLMTDLRELFVDWMGFDLTQIHSAVIGVHTEGARVVIFGDVGEEIELPRVEDAEGTVYQMPLNRLLGMKEDPDAAMADAGMGPLIYLRPLEGPRQGLVLGLSQEDVTAGTGLSGGHGEELRKLLQAVDADGPSAVFAGVTGAIPELALMEVPVPDSIVISFGDPVTLAASGDEATLGELAEFIDIHFQDLRGQVAEEYEERDELDYTQRALLTYGYHLMEGLAAHLQPERTTGMLRYDVEFAERGLMMALTLGSSLGMWVSELGYLPFFEDPYSDSTVAPRSREVVTAVRDIEPCTALTAEMVESREVPEQFLPANPLLGIDLPIYVGATVSQRVDNGAMLLTSDFEMGLCD